MLFKLHDLMPCHLITAHEKLCLLLFFIGTMRFQHPLVPYDVISKECHSIRFRTIKKLHYDMY